MRQWVKKWVDALRSGEYEQCKCLLSNGRGYCCLGVLTKLQHYPFTANNESTLSLRLAEKLHFTTVGYFYINEPIKEFLRSFGHKVELGQTSCLSFYNDRNLNFNNIADLIELVEKEGLWLKDNSEYEHEKLYKDEN